MKYFKLYIRKHFAIFAVCFILWLVSVIWGMYTAFSQDKGFISDVDAYIKSLVSEPPPVLAIIKNGLKLDFGFLLISLFCVSSAFFIPLSVCIVCLRGFSCGFTSALLTHIMGFDAIRALLGFVVLPLFFKLPFIFMIFMYLFDLPLSTPNAKHDKRARSTQYLSGAKRILLLFLPLLLFDLIEGLAAPFMYSLFRV